MDERRFEAREIGQVRRQGVEVWIELLPDCRPGLLHLDWFSHVLVLWWADERGR